MIYIGSCDDGANECDYLAVLLQMYVPKKKIMFCCKNPVMDSLLNDALNRAEEKGIVMRLKVKALDWAFLAEIELTTLFAHLLNNAIEACESLPDGKRWITMRIGEAYHHAVIALCNPYKSGQIAIRAGKIISTKEDHCGIGLGKVNSVIEKHNGNMVIETKHAIFAVKIIIPNDI